MKASANQTDTNKPVYLFTNDENNISISICVGNTNIKINITREEKEGSSLPQNSSEKELELIKNVNTSGNESPDFYEFAHKFIDDNKNVYSDNTNKLLISEVNKLKGFRPNLNFSEINYDFFLQYQNYLIRVLENKPNTVEKSIKKIKMIINAAFRTGIIPFNPVPVFKVKTTTPFRAFLTRDELEVLKNIYNQKNIRKQLQETLRAFLFSCYTGLRFGDVKNLDYKDIALDYISLIQSKTGSQLTLPLSEKAKLLIDRKPTGGQVFRLRSNIKTNAYLKELMEKAGIKKKITFHCARHTFATVSLNIGIPLDVVSKFLGHSDLKTTQIYAKLFDKTKFEQMGKWDLL